LRIDLSYSIRLRVLFSFTFAITQSTFWSLRVNLFSSQFPSWNIHIRFP